MPGDRDPALRARCRKGERARLAARRPPGGARLRPRLCLSVRGARVGHVSLRPGRGRRRVRRGRALAAARIATPLPGRGEALLRFTQRFCADHSRAASCSGLRHLSAGPGTAATTQPVHRRRPQARKPKPEGVAVSARARHRGFPFRGGGGGSPGALRLRVRAGQPRAALPPTSRPPRVGGSFPRGPSQVLLSLVVRLFVHWPHASPSEAILARGSVTWLWAPAPARDRVTKARTDRRTDRRHRCRRSGPRPSPETRPSLSPRGFAVCGSVRGLALRDLSRRGVCRRRAPAESALRRGAGSRRTASRGHGAVGSARNQRTGRRAGSSSQQVSADKYEGRWCSAVRKTRPRTRNG